MPPSVGLGAQVLQAAQMSPQRLDDPGRQRDRSLLMVLRRPDAGLLGDVYEAVFEVHIAPLEVEELPVPKPCVPGQHCNEVVRMSRVGDHLLNLGTRQNRRLLLRDPQARGLAGQGIGSTGCVFGATSDDG